MVSVGLHEAAYYSKYSQQYKNRQPDIIPGAWPGCPALRPATGRLDGVARRRGDRAHYKKTPAALSGQAGKPCCGLVGLRRQVAQRL